VGGGGVRACGCVWVLAAVRAAASLKLCWCWCWWGLGGQAFKQKGCHLVPAMEVATGRPECRKYATSMPFTVDPRDFEAALVNAVQHSGAWERAHTYARPRTYTHMPA
jgi:hypothetical protein